MYLRPGTLGEAVEALAAHGGRVLSGGTDFFPTLGDRPLREPVIDISGIGELAGVSVTANEIRIGARTTWSTLVATPLPRAFDALKAAAREVGSIQIQNAGTVAGNLCNASPAADGVPPLFALDAVVELRSTAGERHLPLEEFITGYRKTAIRPGELVTAIIVPRTIEGRSAFLKLGARRYLVISIAMVAAIVESDRDGRVSQARIAVGACSAVAQRLRALEQDLVGAPIGSGLGNRVTREHLTSLTPIGDVRATAEYRRDAALTLVRRALDACLPES
ncbi:FAD binding domain-containing protein [Microvirga massiliensis]|uniref:FAD binding domain-containing protein n=1 Tax=Microvirga massiliensis TaxID=1033741 RepID=UPI00062B6AA1|nr:xanthine dehydrogenase family protein subunit M [Microvirga massiliensis]